MPRPLNCPRCRASTEYRNRRIWTVTGRSKRAPCISRGAPRIHVECICLECSTTWYTGHPLALKEFRERPAEMLATSIPLTVRS